MVIAAIGLLWWGGSASQSEAGTWQGTDVACLPGGHANAAMHWHSDLRIFVDGEPVMIPANTGINATCMAEVHTHDTSGELHVESVDAGAELTVSDFFSVWGQPLERDGFSLEAMVNNEPVENIGDYVIRDGEVITLRYWSQTSDAATSSQDESATTSDDASADAEMETDSQTPPTLPPPPSAGPGE